MRSTLGLFLSYVSCNWIAKLGTILVTTSAVVFLSLAFQSFSNPYYGIIAFMILPGIFVVGLLLIPLGVWRCARRLGGLENVVRLSPASPEAMRVYGLIAMISIVNVAIVTAATYQGVKYMDSNQFCGTTCHTVMIPQFTAYQNSPHARVHCVDCHIGPGTEWFVQYKLSGIGQVLAVTFDTYHRPIPPAIRSLRPSQDTCEQCHWPQKFHADKLQVIRRYEEDEKSTERITVLLMRVGTRIHKAHVGRRIEYMTTDPAKQKIPWVAVDGTEYKTGTPATGERRVMDCVDCHNRPTHEFELPAPAVDKVMAAGLLNRSVPYAKRDAVQALNGQKDLNSAPEAVRMIYSRNIYPNMAITWGTYPNNIGHESFPGCFRCHDDEHISSDGKTITQDCSACHEMLAVAEDKPEILKTLGVE
jgi:hypothetical protein